MPTHRRNLAALALALLLTACNSGAKGGSSGGQPASEPVPALSGQLLITGESTLDLITKGRKSSIAKAPTVSSYFEYPTYSPDCKMFAYVLATTPTGQGQDWGNDIYIANSDGSNATLIFKHDKPGALIDSLSWSPDGQSIVFAYQRALYDLQNHYTGSIYRIDKLSLSSGAFVTLTNNAMQPSVSWDGKQIVFVEFPQNDFQASSLALASSDGSGSRPLLTDQKGFQSFFAPHLSPDGKKILFAAVGGPLALPGASATPSFAGHREPTFGLDLVTGAIARRLAPSAARADGSPYQVWIANLDGTGLHTIANLREDLPYPVWAADGQSILFLGAGGLYTAGQDGTNLKRIGPGVPHGELAWCQAG